MLYIILFQPLSCSVLFYFFKHLQKTIVFAGSLCKFMFGRANTWHFHSVILGTTYHLVDATFLSRFLFFFVLSLTLTHTNHCTSLYLHRSIVLKKEYLQQKILLVTIALKVSSLLLLYTKYILT